MSTTAQKLQSILDSKTAIKAAIEDCGVVVDNAPLAQYADKISKLKNPNNSDTADVIFYDYTGKKVATYTIAEAKALTSLPTPPSHSGLEFVGWNWSLNDIKTYNRRFANIGPMYNPVDNATHFKIEILDPNVDSFSIGMALYSRLALQVDYGDGQTQNFGAASESWTRSYNVTHTYSKAGKYDVKIKIVSNTDNSKYAFYSREVHRSVSYVIKEVNIGKNVTVLTNMLDYLCTIVSVNSDTYFNSDYCIQRATIPQITFPPNLITLGNTSFQVNKTEFCFPKTCQISNTFKNPFYYHMGKRAICPDMSVTLTSSAFFDNCWYCEVISIPAGVSCNKLFYNTNSVLSLRFLDIENGYVPISNLTFYAGTLTTESILDLFNKLGTTTNAITITLGTTCLNRLTAAQKAIATNKGYTLA